MARNKFGLTNRIRKRLTGHELRRVVGRGLRYLPRLSLRLGVGNRALPYEAVADRLIARKTYEDTHKIPVEDRAQFDRFRAALGPYYADGVLTLRCRMSVYAVRDACLFLATNAFLHGPTGASLEAGNRLDKGWSKQSPTLAFRNLHIAGRVLSITDTPRGFSHYFHFILDKVRYVLHALREAPDLLPLTVVVRGRQKGFQRAALDAFTARYPGLTVRALPDDVRLTADEFIVVERLVDHNICRFAGAEDLALVRNLYLTHYGIDAGTPHRRIYISRDRSRLRRTLNEAEVVARLGAAGFETIYAEALRHEEQVRAMAEAAALFATHGAGLTNLLFAQAGARLIETYPADFLWPSFAALALQMGLSAGWVPGGPTGAYENFSVDLAALDAELARLPPLRPPAPGAP